MGIWRWIFEVEANFFPTQIYYLPLWKSSDLSSSKWTHTNAHMLQTCSSLHSDVYKLTWWTACCKRERTSLPFSHYSHESIFLSLILAASLRFLQHFSVAFLSFHHFFLFFGIVGNAPKTFSTSHFICMYSEFYILHK